MITSIDPRNQLRFHLETTQEIRADIHDPAAKSSDMESTADRTFAHISRLRQR